MRKYVFAGLVMISAITACQKKNSPSLNSSSSAIVTGATPTASTNNAVTAPVPYNVPRQEAVLTRESNVLKLAYQQKMALMLDAGAYSRSYNITFKQDFSNSILKDFTYTNATINGNVTTDWATGNLNEVTKSTKDTTVNGVKLVKIYFERKFNFSKSYSSETEAAAQFNLIKQQSQKVVFSVYYQPQSDSNNKNDFTLDLTL